MKRKWSGFQPSWRKPSSRSVAPGGRMTRRWPSSAWARPASAAISSAVASPGRSARSTFRNQIFAYVSLKSAGPKRVSTTRSTHRSRRSSSNAAARSSSLIAGPACTTEHRELGDVAAEEEPDRPVGDHAELSRHERELVEVVRPRDEPADEAAEAEAEDVGDPLVPAERRDLAEHSVAIGLRLSAEVLREAAGLAERVLARRWIELAGRGFVRHPGTVAERPHVLTLLDTERRADLHASLLVHREPELAYDRGCANSRRPDERVRVDALAVRERRGVFLHGIQSGPDPDVDSPLDELARRIVAEPRGYLGEDLGRSVHEHPALLDFPEARVVAERVADEVGELRQRLDARIARSHEDEREVAPGNLGIDDRIRRLELAKNVVPERDCVGEVLETQRVFGEARNREGAGDGAERDDEVLVFELDAARLRLDIDLPRAFVDLCDLAEDEVGVRAHHPERNDDVARLEGARSGFRQRRRVEHEVLAADDRAGGGAEQPADVASRDPAAEDERSALGVAVLHLCGFLQHALEERKRARLVEKVVQVPALRRLDARRAAALTGAAGEERRRISDPALDLVEPAAGDSHAPRVAVVDEDRRSPRLVMEVGRKPPDVPAVAHRPEGKERDHRVLGRVERPEKARHLVHAVEHPVLREIPDRLRLEGGLGHQERHEVKRGLAPNRLLLVADHLLCDADAAERDLHPHASLDELGLLDRRHRLLLRLRVEVTAERLDEGCAALVVEPEDVVGLAHVEVDRAVVDRGVRAFLLDEAEHRARIGLDNRVGLRARRAEGEAPRRIVAARPDIAGLRLLQLTGVRERFCPRERLVAEEHLVTLVERRLERRREHVAVQHAWVGMVEDGGLDVAAHQRLRLAHEELVEGVLARDEDGEPVASSPGAPPLLP